MSVNAVEAKAWRRAQTRRYAHVPPVPVMVTRLADRWESAPQDARDSGALWYPRFAQLATELAQRHGFTVEQSAGVLAWTSPRVSVRENLHRAHTVLAALADGLDPMRLPLGLGDHVGKAARVATGDMAPLAMDSGSLTRSRKVRSFYRNILGDPDAVTIDVWTLRAVGVVDVDSLTRGAYVAVAGSFRLAAMDIGATARDLQATVWTMERPGDDALEYRDLLDIVRSEPVRVEESIPL